MKRKVVQAIISYVYRTFAQCMICAGVSDDSRKNGDGSRTELVVFGAYYSTLYSAWIEYVCRLATES